MTPSCFQFSSDIVVRDGEGGRTGAGGAATDGAGFFSAFRNITSIRCVAGTAVVVNAPSRSRLGVDDDDELFALFLFGCLSDASADGGVEVLVFEPSSGAAGSAVRAGVVPWGMRWSIKSWFCAKICSRMLFWVTMAVSSCTKASKRRSIAGDSECWVALLWAPRAGLFVSVGSAVERLSVAA